MTLVSSSGMEKGEIADADALSAPATMPLLGRGAVVLLVLATFGAALAFLAPLVYTLALRVDELVPGDQAAIGYIIGAGSLVTLLASPLTGVLSDRTRSRWGRRRPFIVAGILVGMLSVPIMAFGPNIAALMIGWMIASLGWGTAMGAIGNYQADRLAPRQRGKVSGLTGMTTQVAPVAGVLLAGVVSRDDLWVFLLPVLVGLPLLVLFVIFASEDDSRPLSFERKLSVGAVLASFVFRPRQHPDFAWNWLGQFVFFAGLALTTTYSTFFYAQRLDISVRDIAPLLATISGLGIGAAIVGSVVGGGLSDRLGRRRPFVAGAMLLFAAGTVVISLAPALPVLIAGTVMSSFAIAIFLAVNQAIVLDVLPHRETQAGRFMAINSFSQKIPSSVAPLIAPLLLLSGSSDEPNYTVLYLVSGICALIGGAVIAVGVRSLR